MRILIIGLGLIGGSIAKKVKNRWEDSEITGFDLDQQTLNQAFCSNVIDIAAESLEESIPQAELILWALPIQATCEGIKKYQSYFRPGQIITDVGSAKKVVMETARLLPDNIFFIGGHPMAGKEKPGFAWSDPELFTGRPWVLVKDERIETKPDYQASFSALERFVLGIGAIPITMTADEHDQSAALLSHLPQVISSCLMNTVGDYLEKIPTKDLLAAGGLKDTTRIAGSNPKMWLEICLANRNELIKLIKGFEDWLQETRICLEANDSSGILKVFETAQSKRLLQD